ncbi:MAG: hypothetical protein OEM32_06925, partial [Acidimicrobiia bacterium]|nr:hypothetical protein [Acidimicrobiia bacterium]
MTAVVVVVHIVEVVAADVEVASGDVVVVEVGVASPAQAVPINAITAETIRTSSLGGGWMHRAFRTRIRRPTGNRHHRRAPAGSGQSHQP